MINSKLEFLRVCPDAQTVIKSIKIIKLISTFMVSACIQSSNNGSVQFLLQNVTRQKDPVLFCVFGIVCFTT